MQDMGGIIDSMELSLSKPFWELLKAYSSYGVKGVEHDWVTEQ